MVERSRAKRIGKNMIEWIENLVVELRGGVALTFMVWMVFVLALGVNDVWNFIVRQWKKIRGRSERMIFGFKNRKHENVGRVFYSKYFDREIVVTAFNDDEKWFFRFVNETSEFKATSKLSYFIENDMEVKTKKEEGK